MNIYGVISANFSKEFLCGSILLSKNLKNSLLIDSYNGFRNLDILTGITDSIYDINDFLTMGEDVIRKNQNFDYIPASYSKEVSDFDFKIFNQKLNELTYENVVISIPLFMEYINNYLNDLSGLVIFTHKDNLSLRNTEKILLSLVKKRKLTKTYVIFTDLIEDLNLEDEDLKFLQKPNVQVIKSGKIREDFLNDKDFIKVMESLTRLMEGEEGQINFIKNKSIFERIFKK